MTTLISIWVKIAYLYSFLGHFVENLCFPRSETETFLTLFTGLAEGLIELLERRHGQDGAYIGCMKSGEVISEEYFLYLSLL